MGWGMMAVVPVVMDGSGNRYRTARVIRQATALQQSRAVLYRSTSRSTAPDTAIMVWQYS